MVLVSISHSESILSTVSLCSNESVSLDRIIFMGMTHIIRHVSSINRDSRNQSVPLCPKESFVMIVPFKTIMSQIE